MHIIFIIIIVIAIFYALGKGYLKDPAIHNFDIQKAKYLMRLLAKAAKSDGIVSKEEALYISFVIDDICVKLKKNVRFELKQAFDIEKNSLNKPFDIALEYKSILDLDNEFCVKVVIFLLNLVYVDGEFNSKEKEVLKEVCDGFGFSEIFVKNLFNEFEVEFNRKFAYKNMDNFDPYKILNVSKDANLDEIKKQYKKLARENHPDFLLGRGADDKVVNQATKKLQEINEAYEILKKKFDK